MAVGEFSSTTTRRRTNLDPLLAPASAHEELDHFIDQQHDNGERDADQPLFAAYLGCLQEFGPDTKLYG